jgi:hypothetical protein
VVTPHGTLFTDQVEPVFNAVKDVYRTALVGVTRGGVTVPVVCYEPHDPRRVVGNQDAEFALIDRLLAAGARHPHTARIAAFLAHTGFPVDVRHNSKIFREKLAAWADRKLGPNWRPAE